MFNRIYLRLAAAILAFRQPNADVTLMGLASVEQRLGAIYERGNAIAHAEMALRDASVDRQHAVINAERAIRDASRDRASTALRNGDRAARVRRRIQELLA